MWFYAVFKFSSSQQILGAPYLTRSLRQMWETTNLNGHCSQSQDIHQTRALYQGMVLEAPEIPGVR